MSPDELTRRPMSMPWCKNTPALLCALALCALATLTGLVLATAPARAETNLVVPRDFPAIQAAVTAAAPGDTITVNSGIYTEEVVVGKDLTLRGAGVGATIIKAPPALTPYGVHLPTGRSLTAIVRIWHGAHVRMTGFTITGPIPCGVEVSGINAFQAATLELSDSRVTGMQPDAVSCAAQDAAGRGVVFGLPPHIEVDGQRGSTAYGRVTNVVVDRYQRVGLVATGPLGVAPSRVTFANNVLTGGAQIPAAQFGIDIAFGAVAQMTGNTSRGNVCTVPGCGPDPINQIQSAGLVVRVAPAGSSISGNHAADNDIGIYQLASPSCCTITENTLDNNRYFGIVIQDGDGATSQNKISGGQAGIGVVAGAANTVGVLRGDHIAGTTVAPVREIQCCGFSATAIVKDS